MQTRITRFCSSGKILFIRTLVTTTAILHKMNRYGLSSTSDFLLHLSIRGNVFFCFAFCIACCLKCCVALVLRRRRQRVCKASGSIYLAVVVDEDAVQEANAARATCASAAIAAICKLGGENVGRRYGRRVLFFWCWWDVFHICV